MPQISLYIDEDTLKKVETRAKQDRISLSKWVDKALKKSVKDEYPAGFSLLCGALKETPYEIPRQGKFEDDCLRECL